MIFYFMTHIPRISYVHRFHLWLQNSSVLRTFRHGLCRLHFTTDFIRGYEFRRPTDFAVYPSPFAFCRLPFAFCLLLFAFCPFIKAQTALTALNRDPKLIKKEFPYNIRLIDSADKVFNSADILKKSNKPLVVVYWLTTCGPCRYELDNFKKKYATWQAELPFKLIAISEDFNFNRANYIKRVELEKFPFPTYHDFDREFSAVLEGELNGLPQIFIYNKKGEMVFHKRGILAGGDDALLALVKEAAIK